MRIPVAVEIREVTAQGDTRGEDYSSRGAKETDAPRLPGGTHRSEVGLRNVHELVDADVGVRRAVPVVPYGSPLDRVADALGRWRWP